MTRKTLHTLIAIIVGLILVLFVMRSNDFEESEVAGELLLPGLRAAANGLDEVRVLQADTEIVTLRREQGAWVVVPRNNYAADVGKLRQLIVALADAKILEEKTSNPDQYEKLGVGDPEDSGKGTKVIVSAPEASYELILGNAAQGKFRYARLADQATSYLVDQNPELPATVTDWLRPSIVDIGADDIKRVTISHSGGESLVIEKTDQEQTDFDVVGIPEGRELSYATVGNGIAGALANLELDDARVAIDASIATSTAYEGWDGLTLTASVSTEGEDSWVAFVAEANGEDTDAADRATRINERLAGWQFQLPAFKLNLLTRRWDDILKTADD